MEMHTKSCIIKVGVTGISLLTGAPSNISLSLFHSFTPGLRAMGKYEAFTILFSFRP